MKVLFVCLGNICRSPMAEAIFRDLATRENLDITIDSAGTSGWNKGQPPHKGTRRMLDSMDISYLGMHSRGLTSSDFLHFDYLIGMDKANVKDMKRIAPNGTEDKVYLFLDVLDSRRGQDVPDPWYTDNFDETRDLILEASKEWLEIFKKEKKQ